MIEYTPELQAKFTNKVLTDFAKSLDKALRERLREISPKVPTVTIQNLRYQIMEANASDISAKYFLYFQDSGRLSEMKKINKGRPLPIDVILNWIRKGREGLVKYVPGYKEEASSLDKAKKLERVASAMAFSRAKGVIRRGKERKERAWVNKYVYSWYGKLVNDFINSQADFFKKMVEEGFAKDLGDVPV